MFGFTDRARDTRTNEIVALKKVRMDKEKDGQLHLHMKISHVCCFFSTSGSCYSLNSLLLGLLKLYSSENIFVQNREKKKLR